MSRVDGVEAAAIYARGADWEKVGCWLEMQV